jgi:hypothetical protein
MRGVAEFNIKVIQLIFIEILWLWLGHRILIIYYAIGNNVTLEEIQNPYAKLHNTNFLKLRKQKAYNSRIKKNLYRHSYQIQT